MEQFSLAILFAAIVAVFAWGMIDNARRDREGIKRRRREDAEAQARMAKSVRDALRSRR